MVMSTCSIPNDTVSNSGATAASCSLEQYPDYSATASGSLYLGDAQGAGWGFSLSAASGGILVGGFGRTVGSFDLVFAYPTTLTWDLGLELGNPARCSGSSLQLGPIALDGQQICSISMQFPNAGQFVETVPAGDWTFSGTSFDSSGDGTLQLSATIVAVTTPEPGSGTLVISASLVLLAAFRRRGAH